MRPEDPTENQQEDGREEQKKIYILPPFAERDLHAMSILILTDGNNRAKGLNEGYDDGGKNVVKIAEHLVKRGDVSTMVACIMSRDNAVERSDEFIWRLYQAFAALGIRIDSKGTLIKDEIRMEVHGDLQGLKEKGDVRSQFVDMVEAVCKKTHGIKKPKLKLILGINYDEDIAIDQDVDLIYRSGMEIDNSVRLSGIKTHQKIKNYGSTTLWPHVSYIEIAEVIEATKRDKHPIMHLGYSPDDILYIISSPLELDRTQVSVHIPFSGPIEKAEQVFSRYFTKIQGIDMGCSVDLLAKDGTTISSYGTTGKKQTFFTMPASVKVSKKINGGYHCIIAPGQTGESFVLPRRPEPEYATIMGCEKTPKAIAKAIQNAVNFCTVNERLKGAERKKSGEYRFSQYLKEFGHYEELARKKKLKGMDDLKRIMESEHNQFEVTEEYLKMKEIFIAYMIEWAKKTGLPIKNEPQFRAFVNYAATSFFMTYLPQYPDWKNHKKDCTERTFGLARYMELVYMADEYIYDLEIPDPQTKKKLITVSTEILCNAVAGKNIDTSKIPKDLPNLDILITLAREFKSMKQGFNNNKNRKMVDEWVAGMQNLFTGFAAEWSVELTETKRLDPTIDMKGMTEKAPVFMKGKIGKAVQKFTAGNKDQQLDGGTDLLLYRYFLGIQDSIGAGLAFRTIACLSDAQNVPPQAMQDYEELCFLYNMFYRIANDISGKLSRRYSDRENKTDCCTIIGSKHLKKGLSREEATIKSIVDLRELLNELKQTIKEKRASLITQWPLLGIAFIHADIAELIYSKGHYRTVTSEQMDTYIHHLYYSAILPRQ